MLPTIPDVMNLHVMMTEMTGSTVEMTVMIAHTAGMVAGITAVMMGDIIVVMTDSIGTAVMTVDTGVMTETCSVAMGATDVMMIVVLLKVAEVAGAPLHDLLILLVKSAKSMGILRETVGGGTRIVIVMMMMRTALALTRAHMVLTPTGTWTLALAPQIILLDN
jgi:hypothetical protein